MIPNKKRMNSKYYVGRIKSLRIAMRERDPSICCGAPDWCVERVLRTVRYWLGYREGGGAEMDGIAPDEMLIRELRGLRRGMSMNDECDQTCFVMWAAMKEFLGLGDREM